MKHVKHKGYFYVTCRLRQFTSHQSVYSIMSVSNYIYIYIYIYNYILVQDTPNITRKTIGGTLMSLILWKIYFDKVTSPVQLLIQSHR